MNPRTRIVGTYLRLVTGLGKLMDRAAKKLPPAQYRMLDLRAARLVDSLAHLQEVHVLFVEELRQLLGETEPPPPPSRPPARRSQRPEAPSNVLRFTRPPPRRSPKRR